MSTTGLGQQVHSDQDPLCVTSVITVTLAVTLALQTGAF